MHQGCLALSSDLVPVWHPQTWGAVCKAGDGKAGSETTFCLLAEEATKLNRTCALCLFLLICVLLLHLTTNTDGLMIEFAFETLCISSAWFAAFWGSVFTNSKDTILECLFLVGRISMSKKKSGNKAFAKDTCLLKSLLSPKNWTGWKNKL